VVGDRARDVLVQVIADPGAMGQQVLNGDGVVDQRQVQ
jgi:hypothetical protein